MRCVCCNKEIVLKPKISIIINEETNSPIMIKKREYLFETDSIIEYEDVMTQDLEDREKRITLIYDEKIMITKSFCEECYVIYIKDKLEDLINVLARFRSKK